MLAYVLLFYRQGDVLGHRYAIIEISTVPKGECSAASKTWHVILNMKNQNAKIILGRGKHDYME